MSKRTVASNAGAIAGVFAALLWVAFPHSGHAASDADEQKTLQALELQRLEALGKPDPAALRRLLADDYLHVHTTGHVEDRDAFIKGVLERPRRSERQQLTFRIYRDVAVVTGVQLNYAIGADGKVAPPRSLFVTQVLVRNKADWRYVSQQATNIGPNNAKSVADMSYPAQDVQGLTATQKELLALEARRGAAIANKDFTALGTVLADDYLHVYGDGHSSDRAGYIKAVQDAPRAYTRGPLRVRVYGEVAVLTGDLLNRIAYPDQPLRVLDTFVTQVARRGNGGWQFVSFQITPKTPAP